MKKTIIFAVVALVIVAAYFSFGKAFFTSSTPVPTTNQVATSTNTTVATSTMVLDKTQTTIGISVESRPIVAYHFGEGVKEILFIGGVHGGYEWNSVLVAYKLMDYLKANPTSIPATVKVTVIPVVNPDGLVKVVGSLEQFSAADVSTSKETVIAGRFNANNVDLNRNFDCDWQPKAVWQKKEVSGGRAPFSEPETQAMQKYITERAITAAVVWYSSAGGVFASNCHNGVLPETAVLTKLFATASGYKAYNSFNFYEITGDMVNWMAKEKIPAISVLLTNHDDIEWNKNKPGVDAILKHYAK